MKKILFSIVCAGAFVSGALGEWTIERCHIGGHYSGHHKNQAAKWCPACEKGNKS